MSPLPIGGDEPLRLRMDVDVRGPGRAAVGVSDSGPRPGPSRLQQAVLVLGCDLARAALADLDDADRERVGARLEALGAEEAAELARGRGPDGAEIDDLARGAQVGARGLCARLVLHPGTPPLDALTAVDLIGLGPADGGRDGWLARAPSLVPRLLVRSGAADPEILARAVVALRALGAAARRSPERLADPRLARHVAEAALAGRPAALAGEIAQAQAKAVSAPGRAADPSATRRLPPAAAGLPRPDPVTRPLPAAAPAPVERAPDRRPTILAVAAAAVAALALVLVVTVVAAPGVFGLARSSGVDRQVREVQGQVAELRAAVARAEAATQAGDLGGVRSELTRAGQRLDRLEDTVSGLCDVLPLVC